MVILLGVLVPATVVMFLVAVRRAARAGRGVAAERPWSSSTAMDYRGPGPGRTGHPTAASVARALGRVEARELSVSPWFGVGIGFCVLLFVLFGIVWAGDNNQTWTEFVQLAPWFAHPLVGMSLFASHRAVTRATRDGTDELFDTCPADATTRTAAFLFTAVVPVAALTVFFLILGVTVAVTSPLLHGPLGLDSGAHIAGALTLAAGGVALGVAVGRWVRFSLAPVVAVAAVGFATMALNGVGGHGWNPLVVLSTAPTVEGPSPVFTERPTAWHLGWLAALAAAVVVVAVARHRRDRTVAIVAAVAAVAVVVAGIGSTRPLSPSSARRIAGLVAHPEAHQECVKLDGPVDVCVFPFHRELLGRVARRVEPISRALPGGLAPVTLRQRYPAKLGDLPPEVRRLLTTADLSRPPAEVPLGFGKGPTNVVVDVGFDVAFAVLGVPVTPDKRRLPTVVAGQARGVVALWLATRGLDARKTARATVAANSGSGDPFTRGSVEAVDDPCTAPAVVWSAQDLAAARALLSVPVADVTRVITNGWTRWSNPTTGTDELLTALGLPTVDRFDQVEPRPGHSC